MPIGLILLVVVTVLLLFGVAQRVLDRLRLTDRAALVVVAAMFVGGLIPDIRLFGNFYINLGGFVIPFGLCVYLFAKADTGWERARSLIASVLAGGAVYALGVFLPAEPERLPFDPIYLYGLAGGIIAYLFGRSRRASFIAGVMGVLLADTAQAVVNAVQGLPWTLRLGGGGALDAVVISGLLAVVLAEVLGELLERIQGGTAHKNLKYEGGDFKEVHDGGHHSDDDTGRHGALRADTDSHAHASHNRNEEEHK